MQKHKENGFTLVEIVVTIAVFLAILPAIFGVMVSLNTVNDRARALSLVNSIAQNKIEELRSIGFLGVVNGETVDFTSDLPTAISKPRSAVYEVSYYDPDGTGALPADESLKQVDITISYNDHGSTRSLKYRTYLGALGVGQY